MHKRAFGLGILLLLLAACGGNGAQEQTLVADHAATGTGIADIRNTATYAADFLMRTAEYSQTQVRFVRDRNESLRATSTARGYDPDMVNFSQPQGAVPVGTPISTEAPGQLATIASPPAATPRTRPTTIATPTQLSNSPRLVNIVTARGVDSNDCAMNPTAQFRTTDEAIYVVASANDLPRSAVLTARWYQGGTEVVSFDFTIGIPIENACIWAFIDQTDVAFTPGEWSVLLEIDGTPAAPATTFMIVQPGG